MRTINVQIYGEFIKKDNKNGGVQGESNATTLHCTFDASWDGYGKRVIFRDAQGENPVAIPLVQTVETLVEGQTNVYDAVIPGEALAIPGWFTLTVEGYKEGEPDQVALTVRDSLMCWENDSAYSPAEPTPGQAQQVLSAIEKIVPDMQEIAQEAKSWAVGGTGSREGEDTDNAKYYAQEAGESAEAAQQSAQEAAASAENAQQSQQAASSAAATATEKATAAAGSASAAAASQQAAADSAAAAGQSEANAKASETAAAGSASSSQQSAAAAAASASAAKTSEQNAAGSASSAASSAQQAANAARTAAEDAVVEVQEIIKQDAQQAASSAAAAAQSEQNAAASASSAQQSATASQSSASAAASSASNAESSKQSAQSSAKAAADSQSAIENMTVTSKTLEPGESAYARKTVVGGVVNVEYGIPKGDTGSGFRVLGYFNTLEELKSGVSSPAVGDPYGVGTAEPYDIYIWDGSQWVNNGPIQGAKGDPGRAATVSLGNVTTGEPGSQVVITNSGSDTDAVFNFTIPRGATGATGPKGNDGSTGAAGKDGAPGAAATVKVGTVTTGAAGSQAIVVNEGTENAAVLNFTIPRGSDGASGAAATIEVGTVTTGDPGTKASVENAGTASAARLNFTIPRGATGATGANGYTPVKGVDYYTDSDKQGLIAELSKVSLPLSGGTMTGPLILSGDPTNEKEAATKKYVDSSTSRFNSGLGNEYIWAKMDSSGDIVGYVNAPNSDAYPPAVSDGYTYQPLGQLGQAKFVTGSFNTNNKAVTVDLGFRPAAVYIETSYGYRRDVNYFQDTSYGGLALDGKNLKLNNDSYGVRITDTGFQASANFVGGTSQFYYIAFRW